MRHHVDARRTTLHLEHVDFRWPVRAATIETIALRPDQPIGELADLFERYFERRMLKFPTVFYGLEQNFQLSSYLDRTFDRTAKFYPLVDEEYFRFDEKHDSSEFDDRSTAFGVASVCYSRAVTDIVNIDYYIWGHAGGDVRGAALGRTHTRP